MNKIRKLLSTLIPEYSIVPLITAVSVNMLVYYGSRMIAGGWYHYRLESSLDRMIPLWPPSVAIYFGCYVYWIINYILIARQDKQRVCQFFVSDFLAKAVCLIFFLLMPTTIDRPTIESDGFWDRALKFLYSVDAPDNLFPSIHCLTSWFSYIGLRDRRGGFVWYRRLSCLAAVLVCISTLTTKQHVAADVAGGILLAEICFRIGKMPAVWKRYEALLDQVNRRLFPGGRGTGCRKKEKR